MIRKILPLLLTGLISACGIQRTVLSSHRPLRHQAAQALLTELTQGGILYQTLTATTRISYESPDVKRSARAEIRMAKDSAIWFSLSFIGIPVARAFITQDSLLFYEKVNRSCIKESLESLTVRLGVKLSLHELETLLSGRALIAGNKALYKLENRADRYLLQYDSRRDPTSPYKGFTSRISVGADEYIHSQSFYNTRDQSGLRVRYSDYIQVGDKRFPKHISLETLGVQPPLSIGIEYENLQFDPVIRMPFHIPDRYRRSTLP